MARSPFTLLSAASLALWAATSVVWTWSYRNMAVIRYVHANDTEKAVTGTKNALYHQHATESSLCKALGSLAIQVWRQQSADMTDRPKPFQLWQVSSPLDAAACGGDDFATRAPGAVRVGRFDYSSFSSGAGGTDPVVFVTVSQWFLCLVTAVLPVAQRMHRYRLKRKSSGGLCPACGYDLRATRGRCQECESDRAGTTNRTECRDSRSRAAGLTA